MYCRYCGSQIADDSKVCSACGKWLVAQETPPQNTEILNPIQQPVQQVQQQVQPVQADNPVFKKDSVPLPIVIALFVVSALFIIFVAVFIIFGINGKSLFGSNELYFFCETVPTQTSEESIVLSGIIKSPQNSGKLYLNGNLIATAVPSESEKTWSETVSLNAGQNKFVLSFSDESGQSRSKEFSVERQVSLTYPAGTILVKLNKSGVYIRPTPAVSDRYVVKLDRSDYTSELVCLGEEYVDSEGYLWCKVETPYNGEGWVRTDLMRVK